MAASAWTYSNWITFDTGSASRLSTLRLHIQEVTDAIQKGSFATEGLSHDMSDVEDYLKTLLAKEKEEAAAAASLSTSSSPRAYWTKAKANL